MADSKFLSLVLISAGPTEWDSHGRICGAADVPLTKDALAHIRQGLSGLNPGNVAAVYSGPEKACQEVAGLVPCGRGKRRREVAGFAEVSLGLWEGLLISEVEQRYPKCFRQWMQNPEAVRISGGESSLDAQNRLVEGVEEHGARYAGDARHVVIVVRPLAFGLLRCWAEGTTLAEFWDLVESKTRVEPILVELAKLNSPPGLARTAARMWAEVGK